MTRQLHLDRLATLNDASLEAVVSAVEQALVLGDAWLQRQDDGDLHPRDTTKVAITEGE